MKLISWARGVYLAGIVAALLVFAPAAWFPLMPVKLAAAAVLFFIAAVLWFIAAWWELHPMPAAAWLFGLLPLAYLVSFAFSADRAVGVIGAGIDTDTLLIVVLCAAVGMLGSALFRTRQEALMLVRTLFWTLAAAALFQAVVLLAGLPGPFADRTVNLIGKWNDFGIVALLLGILFLLDLEFGGLSRRWRVGAGICGVVVLWLLAMVNFSVVWALLLAAAVGIGVVSWLGKRRAPWVPIIAAVVAAIFFFFGVAINMQLASVIPVTSLEVRPGLSSTFDIITQTHGSSVKNTAVGMGPNTFGLMWLAHKPAAVNQSQFWNLDFSVGFSTLLTAFGSVGLVGLIAWLVPLLLVFAALWRARTHEQRLLMWSLGLGALILWVLLAVYAPSPDLIVLFFALGGACVGLAGTGSRLRSRPAVLVAALVLVVALGWSGFMSTRRAAAESYIGMASTALQAGDLAAAQSYTQTSRGIETNPENLRLAVAVGGAMLQQLAAEPASSSTQQEFTNTLKDTIAAGQQAVVLDPLDYRSYVSLGQIYSLLAINKVQGAYDSAKAAYQAAETYSPLNPTIPLMLAQLEASAGTVQGFTDALKQSLTLKPDYTDAILLLAQADIARNDIASAINDTKVAAQTAPGVPSIWLQLGLLYYANKDAADAIPALEQALKIEPDYANAQYYLGLAYAAQGRTQDATALFEQLNQTNPGNTQVENILSNLQAGRPPLATSTQATTTP